MDSVIVQHSCSQTSLICFNVKDYFFFLDKNLFFGDELIYEDGEDVIFLNGEREGFQTYYLSYDQYYYRINWKHGKYEGRQIKYYESGEKLSVINMKENNLEGFQICYYPSGRKKTTMNCKNNKKEGLEVCYYESGAKKYEKNWDNDRRECHQVWYKESGEKYYDKVQTFPYPDAIIFNWAPFEFFHCDNSHHDKWSTS